MQKEKNLGFKKQINVSNRGYKIIYIERAKIIVDKSTLVYIKKEENQELYFNIPYLNTSILMLGTGTSITNEAIRLASDNSIIIMFVNSIYKPSAHTDFTCLTYNSEYKEQKYNQRFAQIFFNEELRLQKAKEILHRRVVITKELYSFFKGEDILSEELLSKSNILLDRFDKTIQNKTTITDLLLTEARHTKDIFKLFKNDFKVEFTKETKVEKIKDNINRNLIDLNYLAYGMSASALSALGISYSFPLLHGKTRRGALVFDIADLIKDGFSIPLSFHSDRLNLSKSEVRQFALETIEHLKLFRRIFKEINDLSLI